MKKLILITIISSLLIFGCSKEKSIEENVAPPVVSSQSINYIPLAIGNYWVYDTYSIDSLGNETLSSPSDSAYVDRDTIVNGKTFYIIEGDFNATTTVGAIIRNENNSIINLDGSISFTTNNLGVVYRNDTTFLGGGEFIASETWVNLQQINISVPAGAFLSYDKEKETTASDVNYPWGIRNTHKSYNKDVGVIKGQYYFYTQPNYFESRLISYNVN